MEEPYFSDYVDTSLIPNFVPSIPFVDGIISGTLLDIRNNEDFAGRYIMPPIYYNGSKSHLPEYMKYDETCSWLSIKLGELFNVSPYYIDYFIEDNFADYGTMFIEATNGVGGDFDPIDMLV